MERERKGREGGERKKGERRKGRGRGGEREGGGRERERGVRREAVNDARQRAMIFVGKGRDARGHDLTVLGPQRQKWIKLNVPSAPL